MLNKHNESKIKRASICGFFFSFIDMASGMSDEMKGMEILSYLLQLLKRRLQDLAAGMAFYFQWTISIL